MNSWLVTGGRRGMALEFCRQPSAPPNAGLLEPGRLKDLLAGSDDHSPQAIDRGSSRQAGGAPLPW
jgi:hypothetical protein